MMQSAASVLQKETRMRSNGVISDLGKADSVKQDGVGTSTVRDGEEMAEVTARTGADKTGGCERAE